MPNNIFNNYVPYDNVYDEIFTPDNKVRNEISKAFNSISALSTEELHDKQRFIDASFLKSGITFTVYSDSQGTEKIFPFDLIPRVISNE